MSGSLLLRPALLVLLIIVAARPAAAGGVGFAMASVPDPPGEDLKVGIWYPTATPGSDHDVGLYHVVAGADHFDLLAPCSDPLAMVAPEICQEIGGFDRAAFHEAFDREVVWFFEGALGPG